MTRLLVVVVAVVALVACAGTAAGAEWDVYPGDSIQDAIYVHAGTYDENVDMNKQLTSHSNQYFIGEAASSWARFELHDRFFLYSENDTRMSGIHQARQRWILNIYNLETPCCHITMGSQMVEIIFH